MKTATDIVKESFDQEDSVESVLDTAEKSILVVANKKKTGAFKPIKDVLINVYENIEQLHHQEDEVTGIPTGFTDLDRMTAGLQRNDLIIVAARPSVG